MSDEHLISFEITRIDALQLADSVRAELIYLVDRGASPLIIDRQRCLLQVLEIALGRVKPQMFIEARKAST